jgi:hypothetical protein
MRRTTTPLERAADRREGRGSDPRPSPSKRRFVATLACALALVATGCSAPPASGTTIPLAFWTFENDLEGWQPGTTTSDEAWGSAEWRSYCGSDRDDGCVKLDGTGDAGGPNAWIERTIALPAGATTLRALTTAHNRSGADSFYRVRLVDAGGTEHVLVDWATSSGSEDAYDWFAIEASIAAFAGTTVTLFFEGADDGPGTHEQRYYDDIGIY